MTNTEMLIEMLQMQMALDSAIYDGNNVEYNEEKCYLALFDELGELNHELKKEWCWWKKTQKEVDRQRVLEENCDIWHFAMSIYYHAHGTKLVEIYYEEALANEFAKKYTVLELYRMITTPNLKHTILIFLLYLTVKLGFTMEDVYNEYKKKNQINYERLSSNY